MHLYETSQHHEDTTQRDKNEAASDLWKNKINTINQTIQTPELEH